MRRRQVLAAAAALLAGRCASPDPALYTLLMVPGQPIGGGPAAVKVGRPAIAGFLDRPEIVRDGADGRLSLRGGERWAEPLGDMIGRILAEDLAQRLPGSSVFTEAGMIPVDPSASVQLDVQRFDAGPDGAAVLQAQFVISLAGQQSPRATREVRFAVPPAGSGTAALVQALSTALGQLADEAALALRAAL